MSEKPGAGRLLDFNFIRRSGRVLVSNDFSRIAWIKASGFRAFAGAGLSGRTAADMAANGFYRDALDFQTLMPGHSASVLKDWAGPRVHIVSVTGRCDHSCPYCAAGASGVSAGRAMSAAAARRIADFIFSLPAREAMIEFQGGEPLSNFSAVKTLIGAALALNAKAGKKLNFSLVSNLSLLTAEKLEYLRSRGVTVCTSLDGPAFIHDRNRALPGGSSHAAAVRGIAAVNALSGKSPGFEPVNAVCTVTRFSLQYPEKIVEEFLSRGIKRVQLGPLEPLGRAGALWGRLGYGPAEFLEFYSRAFDHILKLNRRGVEVYEKGALMYIKHIISGSRPRYQNLDLLNRLAYGCDGSVYGSDEARLLAESGNSFFRLGNVKDDSFSEIVSRPLSRTLILSCFQRLTQPRCARCVFSAYCRVSPVYNYCSQNSFWGDMMTNGRCRIFMGIFGMILDKMAGRGNLKIMEDWAEKYS